jgi:hypothetical protein
MPTASVLAFSHQCAFFAPLIHGTTSASNARYCFFLSHLCCGGSERCLCRCGRRNCSSVVSPLHACVWRLPLVDFTIY